MSTPIVLHPDVNASRRDYDDTRRENKLRVTSAFYTFQGEGPYAGWPSIFLRLAGCNIGLKQDCPWCDTKFDLASSHVEDVHDLCRRFERHPLARLVVITGGEPLLQWDTLVHVITQANLYRLEMGLQPITWQVETNGLLLREEMMLDARRSRVHFVVSPKIPHTAHFHRALPDWLFSHPSYVTLKYVVDADPASPYHRLPEEVTSRVQYTQCPAIYVSGMTVYRRPLAKGEVASMWDTTLVDHARTAQNYRHAAGLALSLGLRVSYQMHLLGGVE